LPEIIGKKNMELTAAHAPGLVKGWWQKSDIVRLSNGFSMFSTETCSMFSTQTSAQFTYARSLVTFPVLVRNID